jgi:hypothetical protein
MVWRFSDHQGPGLYADYKQAKSLPKGSYSTPLFFLAFPDLHRPVKLVRHPR